MLPVHDMCMFLHVFLHLEKTAFAPLQKEERKNEE